eukprot:GSChrysophyteH2.ASY1.ANO1.352.1 assembled CDS
MRHDNSLANLGHRLLSSSLEVRVALRSLLSAGWHAYNPGDEFVRMGIPNRNWRMTVVNKHYDLCSTYPHVLVVPSKISDAQLQDAATFRSIRRIPTLVWRSKLNGATICRCSQPLVGILGGILGTGNAGDEALVNAIHLAGMAYIPHGEAAALGMTPPAPPAQKEDGATSASATGVPTAAQPSVTPLPASASARAGGQRTSVRASVKASARKRPYIILDCRPQLNARANQANGKGFEQEHRYENISVQWMDIDNIHVVRQSLHSLEEQCAKRSGDGWDRTPQLTSLGMLMLDPYYRTVKGFIVLIEKEWVSFGHKFQDRTGWSAEGHSDEKERSPVFIQWLDCVHQCLRQRPNDFEFKEELLLFIARHVYSGWFGNFLFNCEKDSVKYKNKMSIISIWTCVLGNISYYKNANYKVNPGLSIPVPTKPRIELWKGYFCPWMDQLWRASFIADYSQNDIFLVAPGFTGNEEDIHINAGIMGTGGNGVDDNDVNALDSTVVNRPWVADHLVNSCTRCCCSFSLLNRKHHCRCCGNIFCLSCSSESRIVAAISSWQAQRVCINCAEKLDDIEREKLASKTHPPLPRDMTTRIAGSPTSISVKAGAVAAAAAGTRAGVGTDAPSAGDAAVHRARVREDSDDWGMDVEALRKGSNTTGYIGEPPAVTE